MFALFRLGRTCLCVYEKHKNKTNIRIKITKNFICILKWNRKFRFTNYVVFIMMIHQPNRGWQSNEKMSNVHWFYRPIWTSSFIFLYFRLNWFTWKCRMFIRNYNRQTPTVQMWISCKAIFSQSMDVLVWRWICSMHIHDFFVVFSNKCRRYYLYHVLLLFAHSWIMNEPILYTNKCVTKCVYGRSKWKCKHLNFTISISLLLSFQILWHYPFGKLSFIAW